MGQRKRVSGEERGKEIKFGIKPRVLSPGLNSVR